MDIHFPPRDFPWDSLKIMIPLVQVERHSGTTTAIQPSPRKVTVLEVRRRRQENTSQRVRGDGQVAGPESTVFLVFFQIKGYRI